MQRCFALVDGNNFYVSCERVFRPDLWYKPVLVMSNNDGCVVARSAEVKALGIKMGTPVFQIKALIQQHAIVCFSSNYALYANLSARMINVLEQFAPQVHLYSIDEAFLDLTGVHACQQDAIAYGLTIKKAIAKQLGLPVCVGIAPTQTLAKLANYIAKQYPEYQGVVDFNNGALREKLMVDIDVSEVWGVGRQSAAKLKTLGICSVADLKAQSPKRMQSLLNIQLARIVLELNGTCCYEEDTSKAQQQVMCSRTFSRYLTTLSELRCAVSEYAQRAGEKLRQQQLTASNITVFIRTNPHHRTEAFYERCASITLQHPSSDSITLVKSAWCCLERMYKTGKHYHKCGVLLSGLQATHQAQQGSLFVDYPQARHATLMSTIDQINQRFPKGIQLASSGFDRSYLPKTENKSPSYTTNWQQLVRVKT